MVGGPEYFDRDTDHRRAVTVTMNEFYQELGLEEVPDCAILTSTAYTRGVGRRIEAQILADWTAIPALRNLYFRHRMYTTPSMRVQHAVQTAEMQDLRARELCEAACSLYHKLWHGFMRGPTGTRRRVNGDITKLRYAEGLTGTEKELLRNLGYISRRLSGSQELRLQMGHCLFGAGVMYGDGAFLTLSPSERHCGLSLHLLRKRLHDPWLKYGDASLKAAARRLAGANEPPLEQSEFVSIELPDYQVRRQLTSTDLLCTVDAFYVLITVVLARLLGIRMCPLCPRCNENGCPTPCQDQFGSNMRPLGGIFGGCDGFGGAIETQRCGTLHIHLMAYIISAFQHHTLQEIADMIERELLSVDAIKHYHEWAVRQEHPRADMHQATVSHLEQEWRRNYRGHAHDALAFVPTYLAHDPARNLWSDNTMPLSEALTDGTRFLETYMKDSQFVLSRTNHHIHPVNEKTGEREPLTSCKPKGKHKCAECKAGHPLIKQCTKKSKIVCKGVAAKHGLRISGRRNELGAVLGKREDYWFTATATGLAVYFRSNTNAKWTWRVPIIKQTHEDATCTLGCATDPLNRKRLLKTASRAARQIVGYFCGYTTKRQVVGKYELDQASKSMNLLKCTIAKDTPYKQLAKVTNRILSDLQCRGMLRTASEEVNLAVNAHEQDEMNAEFVRTFRTQCFFGRRLLEAYESVKRDAVTTWTTVPRPRSLTILDHVKEIPHVHLYGYRGRDPSLYYLSPWEFSMHWTAEKLWPPAHSLNWERPVTKWTDVGHAFYLAHRSDDPAPELIPGEHWTVIEPQENPARCDYITFPDRPRLATFRHEWVLVRNHRPMVPAPHGTPLPDKRHGSEERARLYNIYLRPWVLDYQDASAHVPHLMYINCIPDWSNSTWLNNCNKRRKVQSTTPEEKAYRVPELCSHRNAWKTYARGHVVSNHARRVIMHFLRAACAFSGKDDKDEELTNEKQAEPMMPSIKMTLKEVHTTLDLMHHQAKQAQGPDDQTSPKKKVHTDAQKGCDLASTLWDLEKLRRGRKDVEESGLGHQVLPDENANEENQAENVDPAALKRRKRGKQSASCRIAAVAQRIDPEAWLERVQRQEKVPNARQLQVLQMVIARCLVEAREERTANVNNTPDAEPIRHMIQGLPGAGKSELIRWLRSLFEEVFGYEHGVQYVCVASQNTMAALINGFTNHSFGGVPVGPLQMKQWHESNWHTPQVSPMFERFQHLRWVLMDESSTTSAEVLGIMEHNFRKSIRSRDTWKLHVGTKYDERVFAGLNMVRERGIPERISYSLVLFILQGTSIPQKNAGFSTKLPFNELR